MCFQASESAPRTHHGGMMFSTRPHNATTRRTTAQLHTQDNWTKCHQVFGGNVLQVWRPMVFITRPHCANVAMILAGTSSQPRQHHVNQTRVQMSSRNPGGVVCFRHGTLRQNVAFFKTQTRTGSVTKTHVDGIHHANHHLSKKASLILVVWCLSQKNIQHECSKDHHWDLHMRTNTSGQYTLECHSAKCVSIPRPHNATYAKIITETPFNKKLHVNSQNANQDFFQSAFLQNHDSMVCITRPWWSNLAMFIARTCSQCLSPTVIKVQWLELSHEITSGELPIFIHHPFIGTTHRSWWYAEVMRWTSRDHTMQVHRDWIASKKSFKWRR